jgi:hypothetical protein
VKNQAGVDRGEGFALVFDYGRKIDWEYISALVYNDGAGIWLGKQRTQNQREQADEFHSSTTD